MKTFQDRFWLVLLGVAVAVLVALTTVYWKEPSASRSGADSRRSSPSASRALVPKLTTRMVQLVIPQKQVAKP